MTPIRVFLKTFSMHFVSSGSLLQFFERFHLGTMFFSLKAHNLGEPAKTKCIESRRAKLSSVPQGQTITQEVTIKIRKTVFFNRKLPNQKQKISSETYFWERKRSNIFLSKNRLVAQCQK